MSKRPPSTPPSLEGFKHVRPLGAGGFADVFLYEQDHPKRQVAVKVLLKDRLGTDSARGFTEEANLTAQLATHPSIVSVYQAGVSSDGRPYLVMEYCSKPNLQVRHRKERFSVAETLRIGIQIAGAVETAHRAGILHRDIKPANILVTEYGRPTLTDFGISATIDADFAGMSIPWSPPESFRMPPQGFPASDVYSLAATLYTLLTNRTPFEMPGTSNGELDVIMRIQTMPLPATGRPEVPASLEAVLAQAMAKSPTDRYVTAIEFARALQRVQRELGMQPTTIDVVEDEITADDEEDDDEGRTRFRGITSIQAQGPVVAPTVPSVLTDASGVDERTLLRAPVGSVLGAPPAVPAPPALDDTLARPVPVALSGLRGTEASASRRGRLVGTIVGAALVIVAVVVSISLISAPRGAAEPSTRDSSQPAPVDPVAPEAVVPDIQNLSGVVQGSEIVFSWTNPSPQEGDTYLWRAVVPGEEIAFQETVDPQAAVAMNAGGNACIEVLLVRANGRSADDGVEGCAP